MEILLKSSSGITSASLDSQLLYTRRIFLQGCVDQEMSLEFIKKLLHLRDENPYEPVQVLIDSAGGSVSAGLMILDAIRECGMSVDTVALGQACSIAAVILASGTGTRKAMPHCQMMIHKPYAQGNISQMSHEGMISFAKNLKEDEKELISLLAGFTGKNQEEIEEAISYDHYFNAEEAIEFGLIDAIARIADL